MLLFSCKSASALDSLPRDTNAKRSSSALNRFQRKKLSAKLNTDDDFGSRASSPDIEIKQSKSSPKKKKASKVSEDVVPDDFIYELPPVSSNLYDDPLATAPTLLKDQGQFGESEQDLLNGEEKVEDEKKGMRLRLSPIKAKGFLRSMGSFETPPLTPTSIVCPSPRSKSGRKQSVTADMIGHPTNFQHISHNGSSTRKEGDQFQLQMTEVAAALPVNDDTVVGEPVRQDSSNSSNSSSLSSTSSQPTSPSESTGSSPKTEMAFLADSTASSVQLELQAASPFDSPPKARPCPQRCASKRKPVPKPRDLEELFDAIKKQLPEEAPKQEVLGGDQNEPKTEEVTDSDLILPSPSTESEEAEEDVDPLSTIRASNGKRLVPGPAGEYITDTANGRWNCALDEIKKALKAEAEEYQEEEYEDVQDGLQRADEVLGQLTPLY